MIYKCPGSQSFSQPHPEFTRCPFCGREVEIWSDEVKTECPACKENVARPETPTCLGWCKYAKECAGESVYKKYTRVREAKKEIKK